MKTLAIAAILWTGVAGLGVAQYRNPVFVSGGASVTSSTLGNPTGLWLVDAGNQSCTSLFPPWMKPGPISDAEMDRDNRSIVFAAHASYASHNVPTGIFRFDPSTKALQTIALASPFTGSTPLPMVNQYRLMINQDGDYVFGAQGVTGSGSAMRWNYHILKCGPSGGISTIFTSIMLGQTEVGYFQAVIGRDIDSGDYLTNTNAFNANTASKLGSFPWIQIDPNVSGKWSTFAGGPYGTFYGGRAVKYGNLHQDYGTGDIHEVYFGQVLVTRRGSQSVTTMYRWGHPPNWSFGNPGIGCRDLQSAADRQWVNPAHVRKQLTASWYANKPWCMFMREQPYHHSIFVDCDPTGRLDTMRNGPTHTAHFWDFYRKRNLQTVKTAPDRWQVRFSCPDHPRKRYVAALGASGIRPGVLLASGRRIWLNPDPLVALSVAGSLSPYWSGGPGVLDGAGEAQGVLDTSRVAPLHGLTVWIALVVLDAAAPDGIAFIPDTYVMKLP